MTRDDSETWEVVQAPTDGLRFTLALTILGHTSPDRVGDVALLAPGRPLELARGTPQFLRPAGPDVGAPLDDRFVSRSPIVLVPSGDGLTIERRAHKGQVEVAGRALIERVVLDGDALDAGVVVALGPATTLLVAHRELGVRRLDDTLGFVGEAPAMHRLRADLMRVAPLAHAVLLRGETGTGKELAARALHAKGANPGGPFIALNLAAVPAAVAASELFGHEAGAFTGATASRRGLFAEAHGGTLFLDEIAEASLEVQAMLLRALETGTVRPVGGDAPRDARPRLITATDADLEGRIREGAFRSALFHRIAQQTIELPPLRERREDVGRLLVHFLRLERPGLASLDWLKSRHVARIAAHAFPGNVRELYNVARRLAALVDEPERELDRALDGLVTSPPMGGVAAPAQSASGARRKPSSVSRAELIAALEANDFQVAPTARALDITRSSLYRMLDQDPELRRRRGE